MKRKVVCEVSRIQICVQEGALGEMLKAVRKLEGIACAGG